jgi:anti-sigma B factor antagonist
VSTPAEQNALHELELAVTREQGSHRAALSGELDLASSQTLVDAVTKLCDEGAKAIVLDIGALEFVDSTGLRAILTARGVCARSGCALRLEPGPDEIRPQVRRLLEVTGLRQRLPFGEGDSPENPFVEGDSPEK